MKPYSLVVTLFLLLLAIPCLANSQGVNYEDCNWSVNSEEGELNLNGRLYVEGLDQYVPMQITIKAEYIKVTKREVLACFDAGCTPIATYDQDVVYFQNKELGKLLYEAAAYKTPEKKEAFKLAVVSLNENTRAVRAKNTFEKLHSELE